MFIINILLRLNIEKNNCFYKLRYKEFLELICKCLSNDKYIELTLKKILYKNIIYVYKKAHIIII